MDQELLKNLLSRLNKYAFDSFILEFTHDDGFPFVPIKEAGQGVFYQELPQAYGDTLQSVFVSHFVPLELFPEASRVDIAEPNVVDRLHNIRRIYEGQTGYFGLVSPELVEAERLQSLAFLTNLSGFEKHEYEEKIIPKYEKLVREVGIKVPIAVGSYDSFINLNSSKTETSFQRFISEKKDGISILLDEENPRIERFSFEKNLRAGVLRHSKAPCEPVFIAPGVDEDALIEFAHLLKKATKEAELEKFLVAHYKEIFGFEYDRIESQLWLRFPEFDVSGKNRRLDIFLRNSIEKDWELVEIKRVIELTSTYRDIPIFTHEITSAIQQVRNYARTLSQDSVKRKFAKEGIEYYYPSFRLVVGKKPQISQEQWRWLKTSSEKDVKITTFDELLEEMRVRLQDRSKIE